MVQLSSIYVRTLKKPCFVSLNLVIVLLEVGKDGEPISRENGGLAVNVFFGFASGSLFVAAWYVVDSYYSALPEYHHPILLFKFSLFFGNLCMLAAPDCMDNSSTCTVC